MRHVTLSLTLLSSVLGALTTIAPAYSRELVDRKLVGTLAPTSVESVSTHEADAPTSRKAPKQTSPKTFKQTSLLAQTPLAPAPAPSPAPTNATPTETGVRILTPQAGTTGERSTSLIVQYPATTKVQVTVNQKPIDPALQTQTQPTADNQVTQVWYNIPLRSGENTLTVLPEGGSPVSVTVTAKEATARLEFIPTSDPRVPADGRSSVTVEGQITDEAGQIIAQDAIVTLTASAGKFIGVDQDTERPGFQVLVQGGKFKAQLQANLAPQKVRIRAAIDLREAKPSQADDSPSNRPLPPIQKANDGRSRSEAVLSPAPLAPLAGISPQIPELEAYTQVEFITNLRPFIMSGSVNFRIGAPGTDYYGSFRDFLSLDRINDGSPRFDFGAAAFATGRLGEWLFTGAFNSQRPLNQTCDGTTNLFRNTQDCDQTYPVYGDSSTTDYLTPSIDSVYLKLERTSKVPGAGSDFFMWGDYSTPELATASQYYTATNRQLHGFKANYNLGNFQITGFYANNLEGFQRDSFTPNGTSGYYYLSRRLVKSGSELVFLETEELGRPGTLVERKQLFQGQDYEFDYDRGSLLFRRPVQTTDFDLFGRTLIRRIVVTYQYEGTSKDTSLYAGRVQYNLARTPGAESWFAASYLNENQGDRTFALFGLDALIPLGKDAKLIAEYARSTNDSIFLNRIRGNAYRLELNGKLSPGILARAYYRSVEENFANDATFSFTPGQTNYGAEVAAKVTPTTSVLLQFDREVNFGIATAVTGLTSVTTNGLTDLFNPSRDPVPGTRVDNSVTTFRLGVLQKLGIAEVGFDFVNRTRTDRIDPRLLDQGSSQFVSRLNVPITQTLLFRAQNETNVGTPDPLYPNRTTVALDWAVMQGVTLRLAQQFRDSTSLYRTNSVTSLDTIVDQRLTENTSFTGRYSILTGVNGLTNQGAIGLNHRLKLAPGLRATIGYERIFGDIFAYTTAGQQFAQPVAVGQSAASLGITGGDSYSIGLEYLDNPNFKATGRYEYRTSKAGNNTVISAGAAGKLSPALTALGRYEQGNFANQLLTGSGLGDTINLKVGLAYRDPSSDKFNALFRYEYRQNPSYIPDTLLFNSGTGSTVNLFALEAIYAPNYRWEFYGKFALRSTKSYLAKDLLGTNSITLAQLRTSYRLGYRWDVAGEVRWIGQPDSGYQEVGFVAEIGYYVTPNLRVAAGYSFGDAQDRDFGDRDRGGFFVGLSLKLDQLSDIFGFKRNVAPPQQQESVVKPVADASVAPDAKPAVDRGQGQ
ncbi:MAG: hypothetical protein KME27_05515 [Lyngbya sp. HA4199-MV5]|jgi:hypothetical protein|nr:hypothetical protein [Lyngbya sp. HA4199-MV5]